MSRSIKMDSDGRLTILAVPYSGPLPGGPRGKDLDGEFFSPNTDLCLGWFPTERPLLYNHGLDRRIETVAVGKVDSSTITQDEAGVWVQAQLDRSGQYWKHLSDLIAAGEASGEETVFASSAPLPHLVRTSKSGEILRWPWVELSLTTTPANPFARVQPEVAKAHYKAAGLTPPPTIDPDDTLSFNDLVDRLTDDVGDVMATAVRLTDGRAKVGRRQFSAERRKRLEALREAYASGIDVLDELLAETAPPDLTEALPLAPDGDGKTVSFNAIYRRALERQAWIARQLGA